MEQKIHSYSNEFGVYEVDSVSELVLQLAKKEEVEHSVKTGFKALDKLNKGIPVGLTIV